MKRVLVTGHRFGGLGPVEATRTARDAWAQAAPQVAVEALPATDGGRGFADVVRALRGGEQVLADDGAPYLRDGDTAWVEAAEVLDAVPAPDTAPVGELIAALARAGIRHIVLATGGVTTVDGGRGAVEALGGPVAARERLAGTRLTAVVDDDRGLLGFQGAAAAAGERLRLDPADSQRLETEMGEWVDEVRRAVPASRDLLSGKQIHLDRMPGSGAGGGLAYGLAALGAALVPGPSYWATLARLDQRVAVAGLVVIVETVFDWRLMEHSVLRTVADAAAADATPGVVLADEVHVGRREVMSTGLSGAYSVAATGVIRRERPDAAAARAGLERLAGRIAGTWTPGPRGDVP
ncbi:glycerate kinase [Calidifontibacter sp. DB0510]|uniref:Glycerate kinase n=1 Tax=Metallococcus carri TaxID=1656884 RepID=A0A967EA68_9MICO|nr:glycerate kinase [Metallococcus carri]NHN55965.1 glycerate kinase [Metallococcus carri]NOP37578.1 hypothetical protein [Calidifontibacter sp. DB2511S]